MSAIAPAGFDLDLLELFLADARQHSATLIAGLEKIVGGTVAGDEQLAELSLAAQSINSAASIIDLEAVAAIADEIEVALQKAERGGGALDTALAHALLRAARALAELAATPGAELSTWSNSQQKRMSDVLQALRTRAPGPAAPSLPRTAGALPPPSPAICSVSVAPRPDLTEAAFFVTPPASMASLVPADPGIVRLFLGEAESCTAILSRGLVQLEAAGSAGLEELMRAAHSIKGAARIVGLEAIARLAHAMEDCFVAAQQQRLVLREHHIDALLAAVDLLSEIALLPIGGLPAWQAHNASTANQFAQRLQTLASDGELPSIVLSKRPAVLPVASAPHSQAPQVPEEALTLGTPRGLQAVSQPKSGLRSNVAAPDRVVRVAAQSINRLMGLAGESLIESRRIQGLSAAMQRLKRRQAGIADIFDALAREVATQPNAKIQSLLAEAKERSVESHAAIVGQIGELDDYAQRVDDLSHRLYREALKSRMRPFGDCVHGFPRLVRDVARELGKVVKLNIVGESTDVDRDVLESLDAPLNHLLRNSLDHGIEGPDERRAVGKSGRGSVRLEARHQAGMLAITVSDDGRGIDPEKLRQKVVERGLVTGPMATALSSAELLEFIFLPGFSTAQDVTHISGRGVGLDAVRTAVQAASGTVHVVSTIGIGTSFHLKLPVTRSVMRAVVAEVAGEGYAFPLLAIERVLRVDQRDVRHVGNAQYFVLEGANIALVSAEQVLGFAQEPRSAGELCVVLIGDGTHRYGVTVDKFLGEHDLVVRPLDARLGKVQDIAAAAIQRDGSPALIFDVDDLLRSIEKLAQAGRVDQLSGSVAASVVQQRKRILVVDDSITVREAERQLLVNHGYDVDVAVDGMDGWSSVRNSPYDLVVSDIDMPRMNGLEMIRTIKQDPRLSSIPIVIVSYKDREEDRIRGLDAGANHYLTKSSFHDEALVHAVQNLIGAATT